MCTPLWRGTMAVYRFLASAQYKTTSWYFEVVIRYSEPVDPGSSVGTSKPSDTLGREFDPGKRDFSH